MSNNSFNQNDMNLSEQNDVNYTTSSDEDTENKGARIASIIIIIFLVLLTIILVIIIIYSIRNKTFIFKPVYPDPPSNSFTPQSKPVKLTSEQIANNQKILDQYYSKITSDPTEASKNASILEEDAENQS